MDTFNTENWKNIINTPTFILKYNALVRMYKKKIITQEEFKKYALRIIGVEE